MSTKAKFFAVFLFIWFWDSAFGSPVLTRLIPLSFLDLFLDTGIIGTFSTERIILAAVITAGLIFVWKSKSSPDIRLQSMERTYVNDTAASVNNEAERTEDNHFGKGLSETAIKEETLGEGLADIVSDQAPISPSTGYGANIEAIQQHRRPVQYK